MAIINNFPMEDSELAPLYEVSGLFPGLIKSTRTDNKTGRVIILGNRLMADNQTDVQEPYIDDLIMYPITTFYIRIALRDGGRVPLEQRTFTLEPGHVYKIHRGYREPADSYTYSGTITFSKDGSEVFSNMYPTGETICYWQTTPFV